MSVHRMMIKRSFQIYYRSKLYLCGDGAGGGMTQACCCWSLMAMIFSCCWAKRCISVCMKPSDVFSLSMERVYSARSTSPGATAVSSQYTHRSVSQLPIVSKSFTMLTKPPWIIPQRSTYCPSSHSTFFLLCGSALKRFADWLISRQL